MISDPDICGRRLFSRAAKLNVIKVLCLLGEVQTWACLGVIVGFSPTAGQ